MGNAAHHKADLTMEHLEKHDHWGVSGCLFLLSLAPHSTVYRTYALIILSGRYRGHVGHGLAHGKVTCIIDMMNVVGALAAPGLLSKGPKYCMHAARILIGVLPR